MDNQSIVLTADELYSITHYRRVPKQIEALALMGIPFKVRPDGTPLVFRAMTVPGEANKPKAKPRLCLE